MSKKISGSQRYLALGDTIKSQVPHLYSVLVDEDSFLSLRILLRDDMSTLAVLKRYGSDGTPMVCFGSGYGVVGCLIAIDATIQGGNWRVDKPWDPGSKNGKK